MFVLFDQNPLTFTASGPRRFCGGAGAATVSHYGSVVPPPSCGVPSCGAFLYLYRNVRGCRPRRARHVRGGPGAPRTAGTGGGDALGAPARSCAAPCAAASSAAPAGAFCIHSRATKPSSTSSRRRTTPGPHRFRLFGMRMLNPLGKTSRMPLVSPRSKRYRRAARCLRYSGPRVDPPEPDRLYPSMMARPTSHGAVL